MKGRVERDGSRCKYMVGLAGYEGIDEWMNEYYDDFLQIS